MKKLWILWTLIAPFFVISCNVDYGKKDFYRNDAVLNKQCYIAVDNKDTAFLNIEIHKSKKVSGKLIFKYAEDAKNEGAVDGKYSGDTLFADYSFTTGTLKNIVNKNPLAFLKKGGGLALGVGVIETYLGNSYFSKIKPIDFERGRFKFKITDCKK
ncbi:hypothetical protein [Mucilaginibacter xinganensis]|nr:hypothetical protein [Mucilaginibacter xinganensis]